MPKKLAVGSRKAAMEGKQSVSKRELIEAGEKSVASRPPTTPRRKGARQKA